MDESTASLVVTVGTSEPSEVAPSSPDAAADDGCGGVSSTTSPPRLQPASGPPDECAIPSLRFPQKLWRIVNECRSGAIRWGAEGKSLLLDYNAFEAEYLKCSESVFKTRNVASFVRQLNLYGFRKVSAARACRGLNAEQPTAEFVHEHFHAGRLDLLSRVARKTSANKKPRAVAVPYTRLQMCQIALKKALEQATRQYKRERFWLQMSNEHVSQDALKPKYKTETLESNVQIIFQDMTEIQDIENIPIVDASVMKSGENKIHWGEVFAVPVENSVSFTVSY